MQEADMLVTCLIAIAHKDLEDTEGFVVLPVLYGVWKT
jgi:hypothetical protein